MKGLDIFNMKHLLVDLYQVCSNDTPEVKLAPPREPQVRTQDQKGQSSKFFFSENWKVLCFDIWYGASPCGPLQISSCDDPGVKTGGGGG